MRVSYPHLNFLVLAITLSIQSICTVANFGESQSVGSSDNEATKPLKGLHDKTTPGYKHKTDQYSTTLSATKTIDTVIKENNLDPSYKNKIQGQVSTMQYSFYDVLWFGLSDCSVTKSSFDTEKGTYEFILDCPKFTFVSHYEVHGSIGDANLDNLKGLWALTAKQVRIIFRSNYTEETRDGKNYINAKGTDIETKAIETVTITKDVYFSGKYKGPDATKSFDDDQKLAKSLIEKMTVDMARDFIKDVNEYMKKVPADETA